MLDNQTISLANSLPKSRRFFVKLRWGGRRVCPKCGERKLWRSNQRFRCSHCRYPFTDFTGTYLGRFRIPLNEVVHLLYLFCLGIPGYRTRLYLSHNLSTTHRAFRLFREAIYDASLTEMEALSGELELDESLFGGKRKGKRGWGAEGKKLVFGMYQRNGKVITFPVPNRRRSTLIPLILEHTRRGSIYYTDDFKGYGVLSFRGRHHRVLHGKEEYVSGRTHINGIEGFFSYAKTWLYHYRGVPSQYFHLYLKETEFRFNHRDEDLFAFIAQLLVKPVPDV
ncbi:MAG: IS1595 family transposase [Actinomycetota bacterium]|nr:IS1595 family transposase [Actinomycetota bacterium]